LHHMDSASPSLWPGSFMLIPWPERISFRLDEGMPLSEEGDCCGSGSQSQVIDSSYWGLKTGIWIGQDDVPKGRGLKN
jgi:hypothetical protein